MPTHFQPSISRSIDQSLLSKKPHKRTESLRWHSVLRRDFTYNAEVRLQRKKFNENSLTYGKLFIVLGDPILCSNSKRVEKSSSFLKGIP